MAHDKQRQVRECFSLLPFPLESAREIPRLFGPDSGVTWTPSVPTVFLRPGSSLPRNYIASKFRKEQRLEHRDWKKHYVSILGLDAFQSMIRTFPRFLQLPLEIVLEIFGFLHPVDLYSLVQTSKSVRRLVLGCKSIWWSSWARYPEILECPPMVSHPRWATILFGPAVCEVCGEPWTMFDFLQSLQLCETCRNRETRPRECFQGLISASRIAEYGLVEKDFLKMLKYGRAKGRRVFRIKDVVKLYHSIKALIKSSDNPTASLAAFHAERIAEVREHRQFASGQKAWSKFVYLRRLVELRNHTESLVTDKVEERIRASGNYHPNDVHATPLAGFIPLRDYRTLTARGIRKLSLSAAPVITSHARARIQTARRNNLKSLWNSFKTQTFSPSQWSELPSFSIVQSVPLFLSYIRNPSLQEDDAVPGLLPPLEDIHGAMSSVCDVWKREARESMLESLEENLPTSVFQSVEDPLQLASAIFCVPTELASQRQQHPGIVPMDPSQGHSSGQGCGTGDLSETKILHGDDSGRSGVVIGWDDARAYIPRWLPRRLRNNYNYKKREHLEPSSVFPFSQVGYITLRILVALLGEDQDMELFRQPPGSKRRRKPQVEGMTVKKMDKVAGGKRFVCLGCRSASSSSSGSGSPAHTRWMKNAVMTWREVINHMVSVSAEEDSAQTESHIQIALLHDYISDYVRKRERPYPPPQVTGWSCNKCPEHVKNPQTKKHVLRHLSEIHDVDKPKQDKDYVFLQHPKPERIPFLLRDDTVWCLECSVEKSELRTVQSTEWHLMDKHGLTPSDLETDPRWAKPSLWGTRGRFLYTDEDGVDRLSFFTTMGSTPTRIWNN